MIQHYVCTIKSIIYAVCSRTVRTVLSAYHHLIWLLSIVGDTTTQLQHYEIWTNPHSLPLSKLNKVQNKYVFEHISQQQETLESYHYYNNFFAKLIYNISHNSFQLYSHSLMEMLVRARETLFNNR